MTIINSTINPITLERYLQMYEILPPQRFQKLDGWHAFHSPEPYDHDLYYWYVRNALDSVCYEFVAPSDLSRTHLLQLFGSI